MSDSSLFQFVHINNNASKTLFLLHGTGGNEQDLLFLNEYVQDVYNLVSLRGNVEEQGMRRFFRRLAAGVFDLESIKVETAKFKAFLMQWQDEYSITAENSVALGFSNGANMILATLLLNPEPKLLSRAALLHAMMPVDLHKEKEVLSGIEVLTTHGENDPMVSGEQQKEVDEMLRAEGAQLTSKTYTNGHRLSSEELEDIVKWLKK